MSLQWMLSVVCKNNFYTELTLNEDVVLGASADIYKRQNIKDGMHTNKAMYMPSLMFL